MKRRDFLNLAMAAGPLSLMAEITRAARSRKLNLLFIMTDQQRFDALSRAGNPVLKTPHIDGLASEGAYFENAYSHSPVCVPARASILTGRSIWNTGVTSNGFAKEESHEKDAPILAKLKTFDEILIDGGYTGEYYGKWHIPEPRAFKYQNRPIGVAGRASHPELGIGLSANYQKYIHQNVPPREPSDKELIDHQSGRPYLPDPSDWRYEATLGPASKEAQNQKVSQSGYIGLLRLPAEFSRTAQTAKNTIDALERLKDVPFTLTCSIGPPHPPFVVQEPYYSMFDPAEMPLPTSFEDRGENSPYKDRINSKESQHFKKARNVQELAARYYGLVQEVDAWIGKVLKRVDELGLRNNTLVVFTSDHGEMLGSHGMHSKANFYEEAAHIPLILRLPGKIPPGQVVKNPVSQVDLFATILDYLDVPGQASDGRSLRPIIEGKSDGQEYCVSEWPTPPEYMVRTQDWKYICSVGKKGQIVDALYHLAEDPHEVDNLIGANPNRELYRDQVAAMRARLLSWMEKVESPHLESLKAKWAGNPV